MYDPNTLQAIARQRFQRRQVEQALWAWFSGEGGDAPPVFLGRIKKLLDLDFQRTVIAGASEIGAARHAFHDHEPQGKGSETQYSPFDVFCLAIGLDLLDLGFKQGEVVFLLRHIRVGLAREFAGILRSPPAGRMHQETDNRLFMTVGKVELVERTSVPGAKPLILKPEFARGLENANGLIGHLGYSDRKTILIEIGNTAVHVCHRLSESPAPRKGRPPKG